MNGIAAVLHFLFWALVFLKAPLEPSEKITAYGLGIADMLWSVPLLAIGSVALYKQRFIGFLAAQMANVLYWYSFTFILFREFNTHFPPRNFPFSTLCSFLFLGCLVSFGEFDLFLKHREFLYTFSLKL